MKNKLSVKQWLCVVGLLLFCITATLFLYGHNHEDFRFNTFIEEFLLQELASNPIHFHYSVENAQVYKIDEASLKLPVYTAGEAEYDVMSFSLIEEQLNSFDPEKLSEDNRYFYILLSGYLDAAKTAASYPYFPEPLSPSSGAPGQLPILLAEYRLETTDDIKNYFSILSQIPDYFEGLIVYEKEKAAAGLFMSDEMADKVIGECTDLMNPAQLDEGTHFLILTFRERVQTLVEQGVMTEAESLSYQSENDRLLTTVVAPAYDRLADEITILKGSGKPSCGLAHFPGGKEYYTALVRTETGSYRDIANIRALLYEDLRTNYNTFIRLMQNNPDLQKAFADEPAYLPEMSPEEMLACLQTQITEEYPAFPQTKRNDAVRCTVKYIDECLEPYTAPAFYMIPPIDNVSGNIIYLNTPDISDELSLFTTLAHEGYPGHLYQTIYTGRRLEAANISPLRSTLYFGGFTEGWAMYVELESYDYATRLAVSDHPEAAEYYLACRLDRQIQLCLYSLLDIAIHYDGASLDDVRAMFNSLGVSDDEIIKAIFEYIVDTPANYLKYYLGYLEIMELKKQASALWSDTDASQAAYSDTEFLYRFHSFLLENGPADFRTLSTLLSAEYFSCQ